MALEKSNVTNKVLDHAFQFKAEAEGAWNMYGSELAGDIADCGICNRPYEEHEHTAAADLKRAIADAKQLQTQKAVADIIRIQATELTTPAIQLDENGHLVLTEAEVERVAHRVIEILGRELSTWSTLLQSNFQKA